MPLHCTDLLGPLWEKEGIGNNGKVFDGGTTAQTGHVSGGADTYWIVPTRSNADEDNRVVVVRGG